MLKTIRKMFGKLLEPIDEPDFGEEYCSLCGGQGTDDGITDCELCEGKRIVKIDRLANWNEKYQEGFLTK